AHYEDDDRKAANMARRQERGRQHHRKRGNQVEHVPIDEVERIETEPGGNRRRRRQRKNDSREHQREQRGQQQAVDRPPPSGKARAFKTRDHRDPLGDKRGSDQWCLPLVDRGLIFLGKQETAGECASLTFQLLVGNFLLTIKARGGTKLLPMASQGLPRTLVNMMLNLKSITAAVLPKGKTDHIVWDDELPGFGLRLRAGGHRSWVVQYRGSDRQTRRATIAAVAKLGPADARQAARKLLAKVALGQDPQQEKASKR